MTDPETPSAPSNDTVSRRRYERERQARLEAEALLESKSRELYEAHQKIKDSLARELELAKLKMQFVSFVNHEFRTPMTVIHGSAGRIAKKSEGENAPDIRERCNKIQKSVEDMTALLERSIKILDVQCSDEANQILRTRQPISERQKPSGQ